MALAQLLAFWIKNSTQPNDAELVMCVLETVRDDISQARLKDGKAVATMADMREYLNQQIERLRQLLHTPESR
jgi:hypothetical protein